MNDSAMHPMLQNIRQEHDFVPLRIEGTLPSDLRGTLYRNGPGLFDIFGQRYHHLFDGDGLITACRLDAKTCQGAVRLVQSRGLRQERAAGRPLFDTFGTRRAGLWRTLRGTGSKNVANTSVMHWQGRLLALMEGGLPTEINPDSLETLGETDLDGALLRTFSAHPHRVPARHASYNFGTRFGRDTYLDLFVLPDNEPAQPLASVKMSRRSFVHDFMVTERHALFLVPPLDIGLASYYLLGKPFGECLQWVPRAGTEVIVVPLDAPDKVVRFTTEPFFQYHFANACERGDSLVVDFVRYDDYTHNVSLMAIQRGQASRGLTATSYVRAVVSPGAGKITMTPLSSGTTLEFPRINPRHDTVAHRYAWVSIFSANAAGREALADGLAVLNTDNGTLTPINIGSAVNPSEPIFVPRASATGEDDGYILSVVFDRAQDSSHLAILDAAHPDRPPLCRAHFSQPLPTSFHGTFVSRH